ncbi:hypothetical protein BGZ73_006220 [Actinomortierella ambigua]|nr:hypothetical protein BGZ73_006220 [Actinomortierella ambigua]
MKRYFAGAKKEDHSQFEKLVDFDAMVAGFAEAPELTETDVTRFRSTMKPAEATVAADAPSMAIPTEAVSSQVAKTTSARSRSKSITNSNSSGQTSNSSSTSSSPTPGQIATMKTLFKTNFDKFGGSGWVLPTGAVVDDRQYTKIEALEYESVLHSLIIEDVDTLLDLFDDGLDQEEIRRVMLNPQSEELPSLSPVELNFLEHCPRILEYKTGEVVSEASGRRRNKGRTCTSPQTVGHKVDGMAVMTSDVFERFYMEASKKDGRANSTKSLHDTRKLLKLMKDSHDDIRERSSCNIRDKVVTFGLRISGGSASILSLRQRPGRFYQANAEPPMVFPRVWRNSDNTDTIIAIVTWCLMLRKAILAMETNVSS